uniref:Uncharacterized protein n=1 Tax=Mustela putorius furo TaxID=9669 RepID=M3XLY7_MUSPF
MIPWLRGRAKRGRTSRRPRLLPRASEGARRPDAARLKFAPSEPSWPASLAVSRFDGPGRHRAGAAGAARAGPEPEPQPLAPQRAVRGLPVPPGRVLTETAVVVAGAVHCAVGEDLQVEAGAAVQLAAPQDPLQSAPAVAVLWSPAEAHQSEHLHRTPAFAAPPAGEP